MVARKLEHVVQNRVIAVTHLQLQERQVGDKPGRNFAWGHAQIAAYPFQRIAYNYG